MSYILDALKKLDQKHKQGSVPDLLTVHKPVLRKQEKRLLWPYLILSALLLNAGILLLWPGARDSEKQEVVAELASGQQHEIKSVESEKEAADTKLPVSALSPSPDNPVNTNDTAGDDKSLPGSDLTLHNAALNKINTLLQEPPVQTENEVPANAEKTLVISLTKKEQASATNSHQDDSLPVSDAAVESELKVLNQNELPFSVRQDLPDLTVTGHIYSNEPDSRVVNINGRIIREGEIVTGGLKVKEITLSGVIFSYKGYLFRVRRF